MSGLIKLFESVGREPPPKGSFSVSNLVLRRFFSRSLSMNGFESPDQSIAFYLRTNDPLVIAKYRRTLSRYGRNKS
jgi:hypothetical protein